MSTRPTILRSLKKSTDGPVETTVKGIIPKWLNGTLYRNGPGRFDFGDKSYSHLFDGQACIHKFAIRNGGMQYTNKLLESKLYMKTLNENRLYPSFGTPDRKSNIITRVRDFLKTPDHIDNTSVHVVPYGDSQLYALTEVSRMNRIDPYDLKILNTTNMSDYVPDLKMAIAHPHLEKDGGWINCGVSVKKGKAFYTIIKYENGNSDSAGQHARVIAEIPSSHEDGFSYFHSFAVSENYVILLENPLRISFKQTLKAVLMNLPKVSTMVKDISFPTQIHVVNKHTGEILPQKFFTDPQFTFHHINAFEIKESQNNSTLMVDVSSYNTDFEINNLSIDHRDPHNPDIRHFPEQRSYAKRIEIPINLNEKSNEKVYCNLTCLNSEYGFEFPMINYFEKNGSKYRYVYGVCTDNNKPVAVTKMDVDNPLKPMLKVYEEEGKFFLPSEPVFVPSPNAESEDDGVLLVMVLTTDKTDYLSILDAKDMEEIARADMPEDVKGAFTFHGFFADNQMYSKLNC